MCVTQLLSCVYSAFYVDSFSPHVQKMDLIAEFLIGVLCTNLFLHSAGECVHDMSPVFEYSCVHLYPDCGLYLLHGDVCVWLNVLPYLCKCKCVQYLFAACACISAYLCEYCHWYADCCPKLLQGYVGGCVHDLFAIFDLCRCKYVPDMSFMPGYVCVLLFAYLYHGVLLLQGYVCDGVYNLFGLFDLCKCKCVPDPLIMSAYFGVLLSLYQGLLLLQACFCECVYGRCDFSLEHMGKCLHYLLSRSEYLGVHVHSDHGLFLLQCCACESIFDLFVFLDLCECKFTHYLLTRSNHSCVCLYADCWFNLLQGCVCRSALHSVYALFSLCECRSILSLLFVFPVNILCNCWLYPIMKYDGKQL